MAALVDILELVFNGLALIGEVVAAPWTRTSCLTTMVLVGVIIAIVVAVA